MGGKSQSEITAKSAQAVTAKKRSVSADDREASVSGAWNEQSLPNTGMEASLDRTKSAGINNLSGSLSDQRGGASRRGVQSVMRQSSRDAAATSDASDKDLFGGTEKEDVSSVIFSLLLCNMGARMSTESERRFSFDYFFTASALFSWM